MTTTTTQNIMDYVKDFITQAAAEEWDPDIMLKAWEEKQQDINQIVDKGITEKTKKDSSPKDPNKPKRGRSAYIFFCSEARQGIKDELGDVKPQEVMSALGARWRELKESSKKSDKAKVTKYTQMAVDDKERATKEMDTYVPPSEEELLATKPKRGRKTSTKNSNKPKRGRTAYIFFCGENRQDLKDEHPEKDGKSITKMLSEMWYELKEDEDREDELQKYVDMSNNDKIRYEKEMETYVPSDDDEEEEKAKKKVVKKSGNKVETDGFKKFCNANRKDFKEDNPDMKPAEITKLLKSEWVELDDSEKKEWSDEEQE